MDVDIDCYGDVCTIMHDNIIEKINRNQLEKVVRNYAESAVLEEMTSDEIMSMDKKEYEKRVKAMMKKLLARVNHQSLTA